MVKIEKLINKRKISKIKEFELERYKNFLESSYKNNFRHSKANIATFPRWNIISGYYAMHDITKLFLAVKFKIKIEKEVHATTIDAFKELTKNNELLELINFGYKEFLSLVQDLEEAKKERIKIQYYTNTRYLYEEYKRRAEEFFNRYSLNFINKMQKLLK
jgi:hypothetical protein